VQRLRLLYGMAMTGQEKRVLIIGPVAAEASVFDPDAVSSHIEVVRSGAESAGTGFDAVVLPGGLQDAAGSMSDDDRPMPVRLLRQAHDALRPGGVVVGHCNHLVSAHGLRQILSGRIPVESWISGRGLMSGNGCLRALARQGFTAAECYYVEPQMADPMALVPVHTVAARKHFYRAIRRTRGQYSGIGFGVRMALATCGLGGLLQPQLFFWARRPC
jgi:SAM-dependent methyltransferase